MRDIYWKCILSESNIFTWINTDLFECVVCFIFSTLKGKIQALMNICNKNKLKLLKNALFCNREKINITKCSQSNELGPTGKSKTNQQGSCECEAEYRLHTLQV